jgi:hypothetical protein
VSRLVGPASARQRVALLAAITIIAGAAACYEFDQSPDVLFESDWSADTGTSKRAVTDGGRWEKYWEFNNGSGTQLLSVVPGGPGGRNALKVVQRGSGFAANVQQQGVMPRSTDFFLRFYMRNDDTSGAGDHVVTVDTWKYDNLTFMRKTASATSWKFTMSAYGCGYTSPIGHWTFARPLANGAWYRFEYHVHFVDPTHVQVHPRVYDSTGVQIAGDSDMRQSGYDQEEWKGRKTWTLASYYAAGRDFCVVSDALTNFGLGNNGQQGAADTGFAWYFAAVQIRTDWWPGP